VFTSQGQAKRFFVDRIVAQAATDGIPLSEAERQMLGFSESDPEYVVDPALVDRLEREISDDDYEAKVANLINELGSTTWNPIPTPGRPTARRWPF